MATGSSRMWRRDLVGSRPAHRRHLRVVRGGVGVGIVTGAWVITDRQTGEEIDRIETDDPQGSRAWDRLEDGLLQKVDHENYLMEWHGRE